MICVGGNSLYFTNQVAFDEAAVYFVVSILPQASDYFRLDNSRAIGSVQKKVANPRSKVFEQMVDKQICR